MNICEAAGCGWICKFRGFFFVGGAWLSHWKHQEISLQKAPLCFLSLEILWKPRTGVLNKVYACGNTDQPFTFSWVECKALTSGESALPTLSPRRCCSRYSPLSLSQQSHCPRFKSGLFVFSSCRNTLHSAEALDSTLIPLWPHCSHKTKSFAFPAHPGEFCWVVIYSLQHQMQTVTQAEETERNTHHAFVFIYCVYCCWRLSLTTGLEWSLRVFFCLQLYL